MTAASTDAPTKGDRTRHRLLDAAAAEVARHGRAGASLSAIATAAGLKPGSIYFHFGSREQLIDAMLEEGVRESLARLDLAMAEVPQGVRPGDPRIRLRAAIRAHLDALHDLRDYAAVVLAPALALDGPPGGAFRELRRVYLQQWSGLGAPPLGGGARAAGGPAPSGRDLLRGALNRAGLAGRPPGKTAAAVELLVMLPSVPS